MKIKELIEKLEKFDEDMEVETYRDGSFRPLFRVDISTFYDFDEEEEKEIICIE